MAYRNSFQAYRNTLRLRLPGANTHAERARFLCNICNKAYNSQRALTRHTTSHNRTFRCMECDSTFTRQDSLSRHRRTHHPVHTTVTAASTAASAFQPAGDGPSLVNPAPLLPWTPPIEARVRTPNPTRSITDFYNPPTQNWPSDDSDTENPQPTEPASPPTGPLYNDRYFPTTYSPSSPEPFELLEIASDDSEDDQELRAALQESFEYTPTTTPRTTPHWEVTDYNERPATPNRDAAYYHRNTTLNISSTRSSSPPVAPILPRPKVWRSD